MPLFSSSNHQRLLLVDSDDEDASSNEEEEKTVKATKKPTKTTATAAPTSSAKKRPGLSIFVKQQLLTELGKSGGIANVSPSNRVLSRVCNRNTKLFGERVGHTPRNRRKQIKNFVFKLKSRNPSPRKLQSAINRIFESHPDPEECNEEESDSEPSKKQRPRPVKKENPQSIIMSSKTKKSGKGTNHGIPTKYSKS